MASYNFNQDSHILKNFFHRRKDRHEAQVNADELTLEEFLEYSNKRLVQSNADGNCLFRSVSNCLLKTQSKHMVLRKLCVDWMTNNLDTIVDGVPFRDTIFLKPNQRNVMEYLDQMSSDCEWGDFSCIVALSRVLNVKFKIVVIHNQCVTSVLDVEPEKDVKETIWLAYDESCLHYNLIVNDFR